MHSLETESIINDYLIELKQYIEIESLNENEKKLLVKKLGEVDLSSDEKQLISIARALLKKDVNIFLFNQATSNLS